MMNRVKVGVGFGLWRLGVPPVETIIRVAEQAEDWGLDSFWFSDHLLSPSAELDVIATLSLIASRTTRMKLGPSVLLLNLRHPLIAAKSIATLDYLSGGRMVMAVGTGSNLKDYAACGIPLEGRGRRLDEGIEILRKVWLDSEVSYHGNFFNFDNFSLRPRPAPRTNNDFGTIDIWIGGSSDGALRRTAKLGDGFFASFQTPAEFAESMTKIRAYAHEYGRPNGHIESGLILLCRVGASREEALGRLGPVIASLGKPSSHFADRGVYGSPEEIISRIDEYIRVGLDKFVLWPLVPPEEWSAQMELIGREIASHYTARALEPALADAPHQI